MGSSTYYIVHCTLICNQLWKHMYLYHLLSKQERFVKCAIHTVATFVYKAQSITLTFRLDVIFFFFKIEIYNVMYSCKQYRNILYNVCCPSCPSTI